LQASKTLPLEIQYHCIKPSIDRPLKLPTDEDPVIQDSKSSPSTKKNHTTDPINDPTNLFKGETQIECISISQQQITSQPNRQTEQPIRASTHTTQNHNKTGKNTNSHLFVFMI
jgi:hypothetical protein